ncbi:MAG: DUF2807 domain-containing protein [Bacteroidota bacterium]
MMTRNRMTTSLGNKRQKTLAGLIIVVTALMFTSCAKDQWFDFAKRAGNTVTINRPVSSNFTKIYLNDDVDLIITQGNTYSITLTGGENLLPGIETSISDSALSISNTNTFNWLRSYDNKITAYVTLPHMLILNYEATSTVTNLDTIREDSLAISATGGSGYIKLKIITKLAHLSIAGGCSVDMDIMGKSGLNFISSFGYGPFHCRNLKTVYTYIATNSTNDCYINVSHRLEYTISNLGNIYYFGDIAEIKGITTGEGKLIKSE